MLVHNSREVLVANHMTLLAKFSYINLAPQICIGNNICHLEISHFELQIQGFSNIFNGGPCSFFSIRLAFRAYNNHPSWFENEDCASGPSFSHNDSREPLFVVAASLSFLCNKFEIYNFRLNIHFSKGDYVLY